MNGLQKMIQEIEKKSEQKKNSILEEARETAEEKIEEAERKAEKERNRIIEKGKEKAETEKKRILARARQDGRKKELETREKIIEEVIEKVKEEISELIDDRDEYRDILIGLIEESAVYLGGGDLKVYVLDKDKDMLEKEVIKELSENISRKTDNDTSLDISADFPKSKTGVMVEKRGGNVSIDNTFEARLKRMKGSLRPKIAEILFEN